VESLPVIPGFNRFQNCAQVHMNRYFLADKLHSVIFTGRQKRNVKYRQIWNLYVSYPCIAECCILIQQTNAHIKYVQSHTWLAIFMTVRLLVWLNTRVFNNVLCWSVIKRYNRQIYILYTKFYILLTVNHVMILGKWPTWRTNSFLCIYFYL
jgi:hypothetical protein